MATVLVFRTNINTDERIHRAACRLCLLKGICRWRIDLNDAEGTTQCILRIETESHTETDVIRLLTAAGLQCEVLN
ncbi:MAG: hypothetical protein EOO39_25660 [Cytophagaceae bacterium]|nr:MAG: hypothetical protein EOO39_25660 [Cytophagaceae bacterium]